MLAEPEFSYLTPQEYLDWEVTQAGKYAYVDGKIFAMAGGTIPHNQIALSFASALKSHLRGRGCLVVMADVKVKISSHGPYHYLDVMVSCDARDRTALRLIRHPCLIAEVLSPSTADDDRGQKFNHYRQLATLQDYVLIDREQMRVDRYHRLSDRHWDLQTDIAGETLELVSVDWPVPLERLDEDVPLAAAEAANQ